MLPNCRGGLPEQPAPVGAVKIEAADRLDAVLGQAVAGDGTALRPGLRIEAYDPLLTRYPLARHDAARLGEQLWGDPSRGICKALARLPGAHQKIG